MSVQVAQAQIAVTVVQRFRMRPQEVNQNSVTFRLQAVVTAPVGPGGQLPRGDRVAGEHKLQVQMEIHRPRLLRKAAMVVRVSFRVGQTTPRVVVEVRVVSVATS
jgi:hypothetical protein